MNQQIDKQTSKTKRENINPIDSKIETETEKRGFYINCNRF